MATHVILTMDQVHELDNKIPTKVAASDAKTNVVLLTGGTIVGKDGTAHSVDYRMRVDTGPISGRFVWRDKASKRYEYNGESKEIHHLDAVCLKELVKVVGAKRPKTSEGKRTPDSCLVVFPDGATFVEKIKELGWEYTGTKYEKLVSGEDPSGESASEELPNAPHEDEDEDDGEDDGESEKTPQREMTPLLASPPTQKKKHAEAKMMSHKRALEEEARPLAKKRPRANKAIHEAVAAFRSSVLARMEELMERDPLPSTQTLWKETKEAMREFKQAYD